MDGVDVSGGEAQKIAIDRALYKDAPFIILDEPTAALDPIAEAEIYSKFNDIAGDKTANTTNSGTPRRSITLRKQHKKENPQITILLVICGISFIPY